MRLFKISIGNIEKLAVGEDEADVYERRAEYDHTFDYLPVMIEEVTVDGYEISMKQATRGDIPSGRDELKAWLNERGIPFTAQWGEAKLREVAIASTVA